MPSRKEDKQHQVSNAPGSSESGLGKSPRPLSLWINHEAKREGGLAMQGS